MKTNEILSLVENVTAECIDMKVGISNDVRIWMSRPWPVWVWNIDGEIMTELQTVPPSVLYRPPGTVVYYPANVLRRHKVLRPGKYYAVLMSYETLSGLDICSLFDIPTPMDDNGIGEIIKRLTELYPSHEIKDILEKRELSLKLLRYVLEQSIFISDLNDAIVPERLKPALELMNRNFTGKISVPALSEHCGLSRQQFHLLFKKYFGVTPVEYIMRKRLRQIRLLLETTDLTLGEIADQVGCYDAYALSKMFKEDTGLPPAEYRKQSKNQLQLM